MHHTPWQALSHTSHGYWARYIAVDCLVVHPQPNIYRDEGAEWQVNRYGKISETNFSMASTILSLLALLKAFLKSIIWGHGRRGDLWGRVEVNELLLQHWGVCHNQAVVVLGANPFFAWQTYCLSLPWHGTKHIQLTATGRIYPSILLS